jgi:hypothetical protein
MANPHLLHMIGIWQALKGQVLRISPSAGACLRAMR